MVLDHGWRDIAIVRNDQGSKRVNACLRQLSGLRDGYTHRDVSVPEKGPLVNNWLHKWLEALGTAYPSASSSYWRTMPLLQMKKPLAAAFFPVSVLGFVLDLLVLNHPQHVTQRRQHSPLSLVQPLMVLAGQY